MDDFMSGFYVAINKKRRHILNYRVPDPNVERARKDGEKRKFEKK